MTLLQDEETALEGSISSSDDRKDALHQELDATKEQLLSVQRNYEELEAKSKADLRVLVKEVKALRNSENNLKMKLSEYLEEKSKFEVTPQPFISDYQRQTLKDAIRWQYSKFSWSYFALNLVLPLHEFSIHE